MKEEILELKQKYKNQDIDWISFNGRVLQEAMDKSNPLFERIKFLAIFSSNLDEFFKVRVSKLRQIRKVKKSVRKPLGMKPNKILKKILKMVHEQQETFGLIFREQIKPELVQNGIHILDVSECNPEQKDELRRVFIKEIKPAVQVIEGFDASLDTFQDGELYITVVIKGVEDLVFLSVESLTNNRFVQVPSKEGEVSYVFLEDVIKFNAASLFPKNKIDTQFNIKISRDAELYLEDDYQGEWVKQIYDSLSKRQDGQPTRLLFEGGMPEEIQKRIRLLFGLGKVDMVIGGKHHNFSDFFSFPIPENKPELTYESFPSLVHQEFEASEDYFGLIRDKDRILHFPYQSFRYLEQWLLKAAEDKLVSSIQISLYRVAKDSLLTTALLKALQNGKQVTIFVEAKARFDEVNNLSWGRAFCRKWRESILQFSECQGAF